MMKKAILPIAIALSVPTLWAEDSAKIEASVFGADVHVHNGGDHSTFGGNVGFGITTRASLFGEVSHSSFGGGDLVDFNGGLKYTLLSRDRFEPYALVAIGADHHTSSFDPGSQSDFGLHAGGGVRVYVGKHWGVQPEVRWTRYFHDSADTNIVRYSGGLFIHWGR
jgi:hypothetical protein